MGQKDGGKWTAAADLQPTISKSDRLLALNTLYGLGRSYGAFPANGGARKAPPKPRVLTTMM